MASNLRVEFLCDTMEDVAALAGETVVARDGLIPLLWFFRHFPEPGRANFRILVHRDLADFVPEPWRPQTGTYRIESLVEPAAEPEKILILGLNLTGRRQLAEAWRKCEAARALVREDVWRGLPKEVFVQVKPSIFEGSDMAWMLELGARLGSGVTSPDWGDLESRDSFRGTWIVDLNDGLLTPDHYLNHLVLSRGGRVISPAREIVESETRIDLSTQHALYAVDRLDNERGWDGKWRRQSPLECERYFRGLGAFSTVPRAKESGFPWPLWFEAWCFALLREARHHDA